MSKRNSSIATSEVGMSCPSVSESCPSVHEYCPSVNGRVKKNGGTVLLFGGTFDPIHRAHVALAEAAKRQLGADEVWFLVSPLNPWKADNHLSPDQDRLAMVRLATEGHDGLIASDYEFHLDKPSYTYQTLRHLRQDYPEKEFILLVGGDNWEKFDHWAEYREILLHHRIAVYPRPGCDISTPPTIAECGCQLSIIDAPQMQVSSTEIRRRVAEGIDAADLTAESVIEYIKEHNLYDK